MKLVIAKRSHAFLVIVGYAIWPFVCWLFLKSITFGFIGLLFAYGIDRFYPRAMTELSWSDLEHGLRSFLKAGVLAGRMHIHFGNRKIFVKRIESFAKPTLTLEFSRREWEGIIDEEFEHFLLKKWGGCIMPEYRFRYRIITPIDAAPNCDPVDSILAMLQAVSKRVEIDIDNAYARVDYAYLHTMDIFDCQRELGSAPKNKETK